MNLATPTPYAFGIDIDGVLAEFNRPYGRILTRLSGVPFPKLVDLDAYPTQWSWDIPVLEAAGLTPQRVTEVINDAWDEIKSSSFWGTLPVYPHATETVTWINKLRAAGHTCAFITTRPGRFAKALTESWLLRMGVQHPQVFIAKHAAHKAEIAKTLALDFFIDDRPENCTAMIGEGPFHTQVFLQDQPWNRSFNEPSSLERVSRPGLAFTSFFRSVAELGQPTSQAA